MIEGVVNDAYEAVISLSLEGPEGRQSEIQVVIDSGYTGFLTLPASLVTELGLYSLGKSHAVLANDAEVEFDVYSITVDWEGESRYIEADAMGSPPLAVGMLLLDGHTLNIEVEKSGVVLIQART